MILIMDTNLSPGCIVTLQCRNVPGTGKISLKLDLIRHDTLAARHQAPGSWCRISSHSFDGGAKTVAIIL